MKFIEKRTLQVAVSAAAVAAIGLMSPRAVRAVAATLVQVTNTMSNPAIVQPTVTAAAQQVTLLTPLNVSIAPGYTVALNQFVAVQGESANSYVVPAGQNLVVTGMDVTNFGGGSAQVFLAVPTNGLQALAQVYSTTAGTQQARFPGIVYPAGTMVSVENNGALYGTSVGAAVVVYGYLTAN
jgi:hypothetical protein